MMFSTKGDGTNSLTLGDGKDGCCRGGVETEGPGTDTLTLGGNCDGDCSC